MLNLKALDEKQVTLKELTTNLTPDDLRHLTNEMVDNMQSLITNCTDADVIFEPEDPDAYDSFAENPDQIELAWTLGHVIVHTTASAEESAALAAELARGVEFHGRSRYEVPWRTITTIAQCRHRLEESRRMRLASLAIWPDEPHLDNIYKSYAGEINAIDRFVLGLKHDYDHLDQIAGIVGQAKAAQ